MVDKEGIVAERLDGDEEKVPDDTWKKRYDSFMQAHVKAMDEVTRLQRQVDMLKQEKLSWDADKVKQQLMIQQTLQGSNATSNAYLEENQELRAEIKKLREEVAELRKG